MTVVIIGFVLMNVALYVAVPIEEVRENSTPVVVSSAYHQISLGESPFLFSRGRY
jgi:hypothetical protein